MSETNSTEVGAGSFLLFLQGSCYPMMSRSIEVPKVHVSPLHLPWKKEDNLNSELSYLNSLLAIPLPLTSHPASHSFSSLA